MSVSQTRCSRDTDKVPFDVGRHQWLQSAAGDQVYTSAEHALEELLDVHERIEGGAPLDLDQYVDIAVRPNFIASCGSEEV